MWPYRPAKLTDLLSREELSALLSQGLGHQLRSNIVLVESREEDGEPCPEVLVSIDGQEEGSFCSLLRHGEENGQAAFAGGDGACRRCEKRFAARALRELSPGETTENPDEAAVLQARCHMGLQDLAAAVMVDGQLLAVLVAGRRIAAEEDRARIQKRVGKLGKLTQAEKRSMEKAGKEPVAAVTPASEAARQRLIEEIASIEKIEPALEAELSKAAGMLTSFSQGRLQAARQAWETSILEALVPGTSGLPVRRSAILNWLDSAVRMTRRTLDLEFFAVFGRLPESTGKSAASLRLLGQDGLGAEEDEEISLRGEDAALLLDPSPFRVDEKTTQDSINNCIEAPSALIGAVKTSSSSPAGWKDRLTKSIFVAAPATNDGLELVFVFGPPRRQENSSPAPDDYLLLWKAARALGDRYLLASLESRRRELARYEDREKKKKPSGPLQLQHFNARKLLDTCLEPLQDLAGGRSIRFGLEGLPERLMMEADRKKLKDVFDCILLQALEFARPHPENGNPSILVPIRRDKKIRGRLLFNFDVIGRYLDGSDHRRLFAPEAKKPAGDNGNGSTPPARQAVSFKEAQQNISWHKGRLKVESERLSNGKGGGGGKPGQWAGRTIFTVEIPSRPPRHPRPRKHGAKRSSAGGGKKS
ncbi:MAG: PocR ligand-binding domain-containing protein [Planctomycetota bacterium]|nr:PocR ligand-binding domain-containing protein [Planctomycetota bacterium]